MNEPKMIFRNAEWVWQALIKQFESETGLQVASIGDEFEHILGPEFEDFEFKKVLCLARFKGVNFEIEDRPNRDRP